MPDINLSVSTRETLLSLKGTDRLFRKTTERLATGRDVNHAIDNPINFFASINLTDRADRLNSRLDGIGQAIQTLKAAESGIMAIRKLLANMEALVNRARDKPDMRSRRDLGEQYNELMEQMQELAKDSQYQGTNLLQNNESLTIQFHERLDESLLKLEGINLEGPGIRGTGLRNDVGENPPSTVVGVYVVNALASIAAFGGVTAVLSQGFEPSAAVRFLAGATASIPAVASTSSIASLPVMSAS